MNERRTASPDVFDRAQALEATGQDEELLREIVGLFLEDYRRMIAEIERAIAAADAALARRAAHTLKGSVSVLGARALAAAALDLEQRAREGDLEACAAAFPRIEEEALRLAPVLEELVAR